jgi:hypothetical protein
VFNGEIPIVTEWLKGKNLTENETGFLLIPTITYLQKSPGKKNSPNETLLIYL